MPDDFDPYYQWLGISPKHQPPNHYRLLGVELFETHPDVISSAADQRMAHVRSFQTGQRAKVSQRVLTELSMARLCLLDPAKKAAYDGKLREQLQPQRDPAARAGPAGEAPRPASATSSADAEWAESVASAGDLLDDLRAASRLTVLEAERLKLTQFELPAAAQALGEHLYREGHFRRELPAQFDALDHWRQPVEAEGTGEKTAAAAGQPARDPLLRIKERAKAEKRTREVDGLLRALGTEAFQRLGKAAGPPDVTGPLNELTAELARIEAEIEELGRHRAGRVFSTRWLAIMGCTVLAAVVLLLVGVPFRFVLLLLIVVPLVFAYRQFAAAQRAGAKKEA